MEAYDPASNTWMTVAPLPTAVSNVMAATGPDGRIYIFGGAGGNNEASTTVQVYDPSTNVWSTAAPLPAARWGVAAVTAPDGLIYAIGGVDSSDNASNTVEVYDPATNNWTSAASMPVVGNNLSAVVGPDGRIDVLGGPIGTALEVYNPLTNAWSTSPSLPARPQGAGAAMGPDQRLYVFGGATASGATANMRGLEFGPAAQVATLPASRLQVSGPTSATAGSPTTFTVTAVDPNGNTVTGYTGTVTLLAGGHANLPTSANLTNVAGAAAKVTIITGNQQSVTLAAPAFAPLEVKITDSFGNALSGVQVTFTVQPVTGNTTPANFSGTSSAKIATDSSGLATVTGLTAGSKEGKFTVIASVIGLSVTADFSLDIT